MVWPFSSSKPNSTEEEPSFDASKPNPSQVYLEDLPPRFDETVPAHGSPRFDEQPREGAPRVSGDKLEIPGLGTVDTNKSQFQQAFSTVSLSDFSKMSDVPCFRKAMLTGGAIAFVAFGVLTSTRSPLKRAMNWAVAGFSIGAVGSWEQCRFKIRQEKKNQQMAREIYRRKGSDEEP